jgi:hypothetical protein
LQEGLQGRFESFGADFITNIKVLGLRQEEEALGKTRRQGTKEDILYSVYTYDV